MTDTLPDVIAVVLVDDHKMFAQSLARMLADESDIHVVGMVHSAVDAAAYVARIGPDVVLIDYQMPGRNGIEITTQIKAMSPGTAVVMLTESDYERVLVAAIEAGCSGFMTKDGSVADVADAIRAAAAGEAILSPRLLARLLPRFNRTHHAPGSDLTDRELQILNLLAAGWATARIAEHLVLSVNTIRNYIQAVLVKLGAHSKLEAVAIGLAADLIEQPATSS